MKETILERIARARTHHKTREQRQGEAIERKRASLTEFEELPLKRFQFWDEEDLAWHSAKLSRLQTDLKHSLQSYANEHRREYEYK
jgi:hypothetical protein